MKSTKIILISIFFVISNNALFAQGAGSAAVPFLLIAPGAKAGGMGESGVAMASDATAIFWNPAGLAFQYENPEKDAIGEATFMHTQWLPQFNFSDLFYDYFAARYYLEDIGMVGFSFTWLNLGEVVRTNEEGDEEGTFNSQEYAITLSYATKLQENLSVGLNAKLIRSELSPAGAGTEDQEGFATGGAIDFGILWEPDYEIFDKKLRLGANLANLGPALTYIDDDQADPLPTTIRLGAAYKLVDDEFNSVTVTYETSRLLVYREDSTRTDNVIKAALWSSWTEGSLTDRLNSFTHSIGIEYWYGNLIALRSGYFYEHEKFGNRQFITFGAGLVYSDFGFDFGYLSDDEDSPLADTMRFSISFKF